MDFISSILLAINTKKSGACISNLAGIIERKVTEVIDEGELDSIGNYAFYNYLTLTKAVFKKAKSIGEYAFYCGSAGQSNLKEVSCPEAVTINSGAFYSCTFLQVIDFPKAVTVNGFYGCERLTNISFPEAVTIGASAFSGCTRLTSASLPKATTLGNQVFKGCTLLNSVSIPEVTTIGTSVFESCTALTEIDLPKITGIKDSTFKNCTNFNKLIIRTPSLCTLAGIGAFTGSPFASSGTGGTLYVPQALISDYQNDSVWSTILGYANNQILPIEGSDYEEV